MSLLFNMLFVIAFLPRSKCLLISWLQSPSAVILKPKEIKSVTVFTVSLSISHGVIGPDAMIIVFWMLSFKPAFSLSFFIRRLFSSSFYFLRLGWCHLHIWGYWYCYINSEIKNLERTRKRYFLYSVLYTLIHVKYSNICWIINKVLYTSG